MWSKMPCPHTVEPADGRLPGGTGWEPFLDFDPVGDWPEQTGRERPDHDRERSPRDASG